MSDDYANDAVRKDVREINKRLKHCEDVRKHVEDDGGGPVCRPVWSPSEQRFHVKDERGVTAPDDSSIRGSVDQSSGSDLQETQPEGIAIRYVAESESDMHYHFCGNLWGDA